MTFRSFDDVLLYCLMIAAILLLVVLPFVGAKLGRDQLGSFGNHQPRVQAA